MKCTDFTEYPPYPAAMKERISQWESEGYFTVHYVTSCREKIDNLLERTPGWIKHDYPKYRAIEIATAYVCDLVYVVVKCEKKEKNQ